MIDPAEIRLGQPTAPGRYLAFVRCAPSGLSEWLEPIIAYWDGAKWHAFPEQNRFMGYFGPIPAIRDSAIGRRQLEELQVAPEYDL